MGVIQNYGTRKLPLRRAIANLSRPFAPQQNRAFATAAKHTHTSISADVTRILKDTKSLAWVLGRLPYDII